MTLAAYAKMKVSQSRIADFLAMEELPKELKNTATTGTSGEESATPSVVVMMKDITVSWGTHAGAPGGGTTAKKDKEEQTKETKESNESNEKESTATKETAAVDEVVAAPVDKGPTVVLEHLNVSIVRGECIAVVGPVGSGKSAFCNTLLREMEMVHAKNTRYNNKPQHEQQWPLQQSTLSSISPMLFSSFLFFLLPFPSSAAAAAAATKDTLTVTGTIAFAAQTAWILNASIKDNILFGHPYDEKRYRRVLRACQLTHDLNVLDDGDMTMIGERGINLSGGQKQRVSVARAAYSDKDIVILDDPMSALDPEVGHRLFNECIQGVLKDKTVVLVTHSMDVLKDCDRVLVLDVKNKVNDDDDAAAASGADTTTNLVGYIREKGTFQELVDAGLDFAQMLAKPETNEADDGEEGEDGAGGEEGGVATTDIHAATSADGTALTKRSQR